MSAAPAKWYGPQVVILFVVVLYCYYYDFLFSRVTFLNTAASSLDNNNSMSFSVEHRFPKCISREEIRVFLCLFYKMALSPGRNGGEIPPVTPGS